MTWEEKLAALKGLGGQCYLVMRAPGDWFISQIGAEILRGHAMLVSETGSGQTPEAAVENAWEVFSSSNRVVINATGHNRREVRWNGYMWEDLHIEGPREVAAR